MLRMGSQGISQQSREEDEPLTVSTSASEPITISTFTDVKTEKEAAATKSRKLCRIAVAAACNLYLQLSCSIAMAVICSVQGHVLLVGVALAASAACTVEALFALPRCHLDMATNVRRVMAVPRCILMLCVVIFLVGVASLYPNQRHDTGGRFPVACDNPLLTVS